MADRDRRGVGERIVAFCFGALACAICLTCTVALLKDIWVWLLVAAILASGAAAYIWRMRRW